MKSRNARRHLRAGAPEPKDLALEIQAQHAGRADQSGRIEASVKQIVLAAYQLDNYGDLGDGRESQDAFRRFSAAIAQLDSLVSERGNEAPRAGGGSSSCVLFCCWRRPATHTKASRRSSRTTQRSIRFS